MDSTVVAQALSYIEQLSYVGIFFAVAFSGYTIPVPEEVVLILGGYLAALRVTNLWIIIAISILGAIFGDTLVYYLSGHGSRFTQKYHDRVESTHAGWYIRQMRNNPFRTIFISRFIIGMRFLNPLVSGLMNIPFRVFIPATAVSALVYVPIIISLGYYFHGSISIILRLAESMRHAVLSIFVIGSVILITFFIRNLLEKMR